MRAREKGDRLVLSGLRNAQRDAPFFDLACSKVVRSLIMPRDIHVVTFLFRIVFFFCNCYNVYGMRT